MKVPYPWAVYWLHLSCVTTKTTTTTSYGSLGMTVILEVRDLIKHYGAVKAVNGISFSIPAGICFGLLGPNGAGKTTTIEIIEGIKSPTSGEILYAGAPRNNSFKQHCGVQFQSTALMDNLNVWENLVLYSQLYSTHMPLPELIVLCDLTDLLERLPRLLSGGQR